MSKVNCSVVGCSKSTYKINKWKTETSTEHNPEAEDNCKRKGDCLSVNHHFIYILFLVPLSVKN